MNNDILANMSDDVKALNTGILKELKTKPASKYGNVRETAKGLRFQSGYEAEEIGKLVLADERHSNVFGLRLQVKFPLPGNNSYVADATYMTIEYGCLVPVVLDAKGVKTDVYKIKKKLFEETYGIKITEI